MKKSIFLFFAAILCAMSASAWSYKSNANGWKASTSGFTTVTMNSGKSMSVVMLKDVGDGVNICQNDDGKGQKLYCKWTKTSGDIFRGTARWNSGLYSDETVVIPGGIVYIKVGSGAQVQMTAGADYTYTADVTFSTTGESYTIFGGTVNGATIKNEDSMPAGGKPSTLTMSNSYTSKKSGNVHIVFDLKTNKVTETAASEPEPEPTPEVYTVVGSSAEIFGSAWTPSVTANDMTKQADGTYKLVKENVTLAAGNIEYKVVKDHNWGTGEFPSPGNQSFKIDESGVYDITFTYTVGSKLTAEKTLKESAVVLPTIELAGTMNGCDDWGACKKTLTPAEDNLTASITVTLAQQEYSFKIVKAGEWLGNKGKMERNSSTGWTFEKLDGGDETNCRIVADIAGDYTFTWTYETNKLTVTYPELPTPEYKDITITVYAKEVPNIWWWNGGDKCADADDAYDWDTAPAMEAVVIDGNTWYQKTFKDVDVALGGIKFKLKSQDQSKGSNELQTTEDKCYDARVITAITETTCGQLPTGETPKVTYNVEVPAGTNTCYIAGEMNSWTLTQMTKVDDTHYTITIEGATTAHKYKYASGPDSDWKYVEVKADGSDVSNRTYNANDVVEKWKSVYDPSAPAETKYYIAGTENLTGFNWQVDGLEIKKVGDVYKHTFSELPDGIYEFKITDGTWEHQWNYSNLAANYVGVEQGKDDKGDYNGNIKIVTEEAKNIIVIFDPANNKITLEGWEEAAPAEPVTVYFINSGNWAEVACYYWGGTDAPAWPGAKMTANGEVFEAGAWDVYAITFPGDNTQCIFTDNKAAGAIQTADLTVENGKYYCYANGIWYERLADVDPLDTRVYLKGQMNEWCEAGYCDMFRKEDMSETVAYRTTWLEAETTYEFKIEDAGAWLSNTGEMTKDNCTGWTFEADKDNCKITTEYAGDYTFIWDMTTKKLSVEYPDPKANPEVLSLTVANMEFDGEKTFSGSDNTYGIVFNLVVGGMIEEGVFALDATSTVNFGGTLFTDVTGMIAPDMNTFASATAQVEGFLDGTYYQLTVQMSSGGGTLVDIRDGVATPNDATGELTISATWEGETLTITVPGFNYTSYECGEIWFETESVVAFGPATITVEDGVVTVEGTVTSGATGAQYVLFVMADLPAEETPDYTRTVASGSYGTICLPNGSVKVEGAKFYEVTFKKDGYIYADEVTTLDAGMPYIFHATSTEVKVYYNETTATAGSNNGVYGTFSDITDGDAGTTGNVLEGNYLLVAGPKVQKCAGNCSLAANRAYFVVSEISDVEQQSAPGRQRIALGCQDENQATGLDNITENGAVAPALQGTYDILGRQLSEPAVSGFYIINGKKVLVVK